MDDSDKGRHDIILGIDILISLGLNLKFYEHVIEEYDRPFKGWTATNIDLGKYHFKDLNHS